MKKVVLSLLISLIAFSFTACSKKEEDKVEEIKKRGVLTIALSPDYPPYEFIVANNGKVEVVGADVFLAQKIADKLGVELEVQQLAFDSILPSLTSGRSDLAISGLSPTEKRKEVVDFTNSYYINKNILVVNKDSENITTEKELQKKRIGVQKGSIQEKFVLEKLKLPKEQVQALSDIPNLLQDLKNGNIDAVMIPNDVASISLAKNEQLKASNYELESSEENDSLAVALKKGNNENFIKIINEVIAELKKDNEFEKKLEQYSKLVKE